MIYYLIVAIGISLSILIVMVEWKILSKKIFPLIDKFFAKIFKTNGGRKMKDDTATLIEGKWSTMEIIWFWWCIGLISCGIILIFVGIMLVLR